MTIVGSMAWDLDTLATARRDHGPDAVLRMLNEDALKPTPAQPDSPQRTLPQSTGAALHPWANLQPAGTRAADVSKLGYTSPGSPG
ncbi:hypothetical protein [Streptomyces sp. NPDC002133]|uniref:hypothetical protein n=1 Tax=Streptomyces sp. NPDC002133 TaxID=3154409 RepID=UPI00332AEFA2